MPKALRKLGRKLKLAPGKGRVSTFWTRVGQTLCGIVSVLSLIYFIAPKVFYGIPGVATLVTLVGMASLFFGVLLLLAYTLIAIDRWLY